MHSPREGILLKFREILFKEIHLPFWRKKNLSARQLRIRSILSRVAFYGFFSPCIALGGQTAYCMNLSTPHISKYPQCTSRATCEADFIPIQGSGLSDAEFVTAVDQRGDGIELHRFLRDNIDDPVARRYVNEQLIFPVLNNSHPAPGSAPTPGQELYERMRRHFAMVHEYSTSHEVLRNDASLLEKALFHYTGFSTNNSLQSFREFSANGFRGACDDVSINTYVAYRIIRENAASHRRDSSAWADIDDYFSSHQLLIARLDSHAALLEVNSGQANTISYRGIEPQFAHGTYELKSVGKNICFDDGVKCLRLLGVDSVTMSYGSERFY